MLEITQLLFSKYLDLELLIQSIYCRILNNIKHFKYEILATEEDLDLFKK